MYPQAAGVTRLTDPEPRCETLSEDIHRETDCGGEFCGWPSTTSAIKAGVVEARLKNTTKAQTWLQGVKNAFFKNGNVSDRLVG